MGLSRNKVAVSEGAAGSPPFYGERDRWMQSIGSVVFKVEQNQRDGERKYEHRECLNSLSLLFNFE